MENEIVISREGEFFIAHFKGNANYYGQALTEESAIEELKIARDDWESESSLAVADFHSIQREQINVK